MKIQAKTLGATAALGAAMALGAVIGHASADQPHMQSALQQLRGARAELITATADKGGHRAAAIRATDAAIAETQAGIRFAGGD